ncbi:MAG TPA: hypothetical protein VIN03_01005 [Roseateles sp.]
MRTDRDWTGRLRRRTGLGLALALLALVATPAVQAQTPSAAALAGFNAQGHGDRAGAQAAAEQGLAEYVKRKQQHGGEAASAFDLARPQDLGRTRIAGGFEVHTIAPQDVIAGRSELRQLVQPSGLWRFFVKVGGKPVGLVTVQRMDGQWRAVSFGGAGLAQELSDLMAEHAGVGADHMRFIRMHQAQADLLEVVSPSDLQARYALLTSARDALEPEIRATTAEKAAPRLRESHELLEPLRNAVRRNLNAQP